MLRILTIASLVLTTMVSLTVAYYNAQKRQVAEHDISDVMTLVHPNMYHIVRCINKDGHAGLYKIFIPKEVTDKGHNAIERYSQGYCEATFGPLGTNI